MTTAPSASDLAGSAGSPEGSGGVSLSTSLTNAPVNTFAPTNTPAAWNLTAQLLNTPLYAGTTSSVKVSQLKTNQVLGQVADKLGIKPQKGSSLAEQILDTLAKQQGISTVIPASMGPKGSSAGGQRSEGDLLGEVMTKLGITTANPKKGMTLATALTDPNVLGQLATKVGVDLTTSTNQTAVQSTTVGKAAMQIYGMDTTQIAALQAKLWEGGFYDSPGVEGQGGIAGADAKKITPGNLDPYTMRAFGALLTQTAQSGKKISWTDALNEASGTNGENSSGKAGASIEDLVAGDGSGSVTASTPKVVLATPDQMMSTLQSYFEQKLGRMPTQAELTQFTQQFDNSQTANSKYMDPNTVVFPDSDTGVAEVPGVARPAAAATEFAQSDGTEYMAHQVANAGALMLSAMREGGGLGANPNLTTAG